MADTILDGLRAAGAHGLSRTEISSLFGRNPQVARINRALGVLLRYGLGHWRKEQTGGRPVERWYAGTKETKQGE